MNAMGPKCAVSAIALALVLATASCRTAVPVAASAAKAPPAAAAGAWRIDPARSTLVLFVYRDGPMAALGHNHVIVLRGVTGELQRHADPLRSAFRLHVPLDQVDIDDPARRAQAGPDFTATVSDAARAGTRRNMLGDRVLDVAHYPAIEVRSETIERLGDHYQVRVRVRVHGAESPQVVPVTLRETAAGVHVTGEFALRQSALGLTPFSVFMGALRVADEMKVGFDLYADPPTAPR